MRRYHPPTLLLKVTDWPRVAWLGRYRVRGVAEYCGVSVPELRSYCQHRLKTPPKPWLRELRLAQAREWLAMGRSTAAVARALFFTDAAHFCHEFKRVQGLPPKLWRQRSRTHGPQHPCGLGRVPVVPERVQPTEADFVWLFLES